MRLITYLHNCRGRLGVLMRLLIFTLFSLPLTLHAQTFERFYSISGDLDTCVITLNTKTPSNPSGDGDPYTCSTTNPDCSITSGTKTIGVPANSSKIQERALPSLLDGNYYYSSDSFNVVNFYKVKAHYLHKWSPYSSYTGPVPSFDQRDEVIISDQSSTTTQCNDYDDVVNKFDENGDYIGRVEKTCESSTLSTICETVSSSVTPITEPSDPSTVTSETVFNDQTLPEPEPDPEPSQDEYTEQDIEDGGVDVFNTDYDFIDTVDGVDSSEQQLILDFMSANGPITSFGDLSSSGAAPETIDAVQDHYEDAYMTEEGITPDQVIPPDDTTDDTSSDTTDDTSSDTNDPTDEPTVTQADINALHSQLDQIRDNTDQSKGHIADIRTSSETTANATTDILGNTTDMADDLDYLRTQIQNGMLNGFDVNVDTSGIEQRITDFQTSINQGDGTDPSAEVSDLSDTVLGDNAAAVESDLETYITENTEEITLDQLDQSRIASPAYQKQTALTFEALGETYEIDIEPVFPLFNLAGAIGMIGVLLLSGRIITRSLGGS
ncbi:MAG: hypothetical protein RI556_11545 [Hydrogenovibrio sp.]|uniref:hypothetical protein n=1 Tax=Hydrogenovibrio sp. TaxID=2065821 RepID=UPI00286FF223|nr:hypothetical protein [Hydrogenovibrio sp.]MDR9499801.1 hypothetical protein [Hydrogenovibrio sp.]